MVLSTYNLHNLRIHSINATNIDKHKVVLLSTHLKLHNKSPTFLFQLLSSAYTTPIEREHIYGKYLTY